MKAFNLAATLPADATLRDSVLSLFEAAGFEVRDIEGGFAINGSVDSAALVVEWLICGVPD